MRSKTMNKIVLKGFYGFGNLGDDILMITTHNVVTELFPGYEIMICSESHNPGYIHKLLGNSIQIVKGNTGIRAGWIIHGGGGVFFDFRAGVARFRWLNNAIRGVGYGLYRSAHTLYQRLKGYQTIEAKFRAGIGIGVGTYTPSSSKFQQDILVLSDFDFLMVRDEDSVRNIRHLGLGYPVYQATDIAFLHERWSKPETVVANASGVIGFVLRDWTFDSHAYLDTMLHAARQLAAQGYALKFYAFDQNSDQHFVEKFSKEFSVLVWDPNHMPIQDFLQEMSACGLMVSSRAHGAIVSACLGIPVVCLAIEPKLVQISAMLPQGSRLVQSITEAHVLSAVQETWNDISAMQRGVRSDVEHNREVMNGGLAIFKEFIRQSSSR